MSGYIYSVATLQCKVCLKSIKSGHSYNYIKLYKIMQNHVILCVVLEFFAREGLDCFLQPKLLPKLSKITVTCPNSLKINM